MPLASRSPRKLTVPSLTGRIITIAVGEEPCLFHIHEPLLRARGSFFTLSRSRQGHLNMPDDCPKIGELYFQHLYTGKVLIDWTTSLEQVSKNECLPEYTTLAKLYVLGEKIGDVAFKNLIVRTVLRRIETRIGGHGYHPVGAAVDIIYKGTNPDSKMRKLVVDVTVWNGNARWIDPELYDNNGDFLVDVLQAFMLKRGVSQGPAIAQLLAGGGYEEVV